MLDCGFGVFVLFECRHKENRLDFRRFLESNPLSSLRTASGNRHTKKITNQRKCLLLISNSETVAGYKGLARISRSYARENPPLTVGCEIAATSHPCIFQGFDQVLPSVKITTSTFIISQSPSKKKTNKSAGYLMQSLWGMIPLQLLSAQNRTRDFMVVCSDSVSSSSADNMVSFGKTGKALFPQVKHSGFCQSPMSNSFACVSRSGKREKPAHFF